MGTSRTSPGSTIIKGLLDLIGVAALLALAWNKNYFASYLDAGVIQKRLASTGRWAPFAYMATMALVVVTPLPSLPLNFAAGMYFGPVLGTIYSVIGATAGAFFSFLIARLLGRPFVERFLKGHIQFCTTCSDRIMTKFVILARLVPLFSFDMISYGAGLTKMSPRNFLIANILGMLPLTFVYNNFGSGIAVGDMTGLFLGGVLVASFFILPRLIEKYNFLSLRRFFIHP